MKRWGNNDGDDDGDDDEDRSAIILLFFDQKLLHVGLCVLSVGVKHHNLWDICNNVAFCPPIWKQIKISVSNNSLIFDKHCA